MANNAGNEEVSRHYSGEEMICDDAINDSDRELHIGKELVEAAIFPSNMLTFIADQAVAQPCNDLWKQHIPLLRKLIALSEDHDAPSDTEIGAALLQMHQCGEVPLSQYAIRLPHHSWVDHARLHCWHILYSYVSEDSSALPRAVFRTLCLRSLIPNIQSTLLDPETNKTSLVGACKGLWDDFHKWYDSEKKCRSAVKEEASGALHLRVFVLVAQILVALVCDVANTLRSFPRYLVMVTSGLAGCYHKLRIPYHPIHGECLASVGNLLSLCHTPEQRKEVSRRLSLHKLFRGAIDARALQPAFTLEGGRFLLVQTLLSWAVKMSPPTVSAFLSLQPIHCWFDQFPEMLDGVWLPIIARVKAGIRGSGRCKPLPPPTHSHFLTYKVFQHQIAVDRAILRYWFRCSKGSLGRLNHDVISDIERYIYGPHSWPRWFFRDHYTPTAK